MPLDPTNSTPLSQRGILLSDQAAGLYVPWCQVNFTAGKSSPRGPYSNVAVMLAWANSECGGGPLASTARGASSFKAQNGRSIQWLPRSDIVPPPKSHQRYHFGPGT